LQKKAIEGLEITEEEIKEAFSLPIEDLFNSPKHTELLNKFLGIIKEDKFEATTAKSNPDPKIEELFNRPEHYELQEKAIEGLEITEEEIKEVFSLPIEDYTWKKKTEREKKKNKKKKKKKKRKREIE
jgi:hypothetical protein